MEKIRKPFQGVLNIVRFNWHFYSLALALAFMFFFVANHFSEHFQILFWTIGVLIAVLSIISLLVSMYVYDFSGFYEFKWLESENVLQTIVNINAGFDETSVLLKNKFPNSEFKVLDFYDQKKHTEISIERARKAYPPFPGTKQIETVNLPLAYGSTDKIFVIFAAHEIRDTNERLAFFGELNRALKPTGKVYVVEHLRDTANFFAYTIGAFHFYPKSVWQKPFKRQDSPFKKN